MNKTLFFNNLSHNREKMKIFQEAYQQGLIQSFDEEVLNRLRHVYYGCLSGLLYLYVTPTSFLNIGNKLEILTHVFSDIDYRVVHGEIESTRKIMFAKYGVEHLDFNSWIEVKQDDKVWVYDTFSMLKIERGTYYKLEDPLIRKIIKKSTIEAHPARYEDDFSMIRDEWMLVGFIPKIEQSLVNNPHRDMLEIELAKFKCEVDYDDVVSDFSSEKKIFQRKRT